ncbi:ABC transporter ATP-binding protein [Cytobacillus purgationiresistens]|uniref:Multiple sugar transport system ATP-binding protein n=1 Tax=Cytobacillus purgationiresistens TaxID=863449 RepID=A0ABU0APL3_9BACI|nr:sn-glycerol-3-phosphate ABC transporter ATP-binding protein UgpC [Cytobacillus purgationiresistens]MDQ0272691.1 multiple sugar transport system ATP-binding protein [Cytobacillus purgationiresistens]
MANLKLQQLTKVYNKNEIAVKDFNLDIKDKEFIVFVGPSGCGKSTILRMVAGLEDITHGELFIDNQKMNDVSSKDRDIAMVFQNYALYPHMTVYQNMAFGLKMRKQTKTEIERRVNEAAAILGLKPFLHRKPAALSGGQRQRVALGRAIVRDANVFLMDEPLSSLDAKLRVQMRSEIISLHSRLQTTTIYVTHDQTEAMTMATRLVVLNHGQIQQIGTPKEVYEQPVNVFVAGFIGSPAMNFFSGSLTASGLKIGDQYIPIPAGLLPQNSSQDIIIGVRPEDMYIESATPMFHTEIEAVELLGADTMINAGLGDQPFTARIPSSIAIEPGQTLPLSIHLNRMLFFDSQSKNRIF